MTRAAFALVTGLILLAVGLHRPPAAAAVQSGRVPDGTGHVGKAFRFNRVKEGVYHAVGTGTLAVVGNSSIIVNEQDVVVVDDHVSPAAAWVLLDELKQITDKPVRYVVNTHFHFDHAHGNQIFDPTVEIIGHEYTRQMLLDGKSLAMPLYKGYRDGLPDQIEGLRRHLAAETDAARAASLRSQLEAAQNNLVSQRELRPTPPNVTLTKEMTLYRGSREIQIRFLGRGHTAGDVVVFLPKEHVVCTGDFLTAGLSNMSDAFVNEWVTSLEELKKLDFDTVLPGHGEAFTDRAKIDYFQAYLRDVWSEVGALKRQGVPAEDAAKRVDLTKYQDRIPGIQGPGVPVIAVKRIYELLDGADRR